MTTVHYGKFGPEVRSVAAERASTRCTPLDLELARLVFTMPDRARAHLLAFLHLSQEEGDLRADLAVNECGAVHLALVSVPRTAT
jgi:hypothetical protein